MIVILLAITKITKQLTRTAKQLLVI